MIKRIVVALISISCTIMIAGCANKVSPNVTADPELESVVIDSAIDVSDQTFETVPTTVIDTDHQHDYKEIVIESTCTNVGQITHKCECGDAYLEEIPKVDHQYNKEIIKPTCTMPGYSIYTCKICNHSYRGDDVSALDHNYTTITIDPTYTEEGYDLNTCARCKDSYKSNFQDTLPHEHEYKHETISPTCVEKGYTVYNCTLCGHNYQDDQVDELGHDYMTETVHPTSTSNGYDIHTCQRCGDCYQDNYVDSLATYKDVNETVYAIYDANIRNGPGHDNEKIGELSKGDSILRIGVGDNGWSKVIYCNEIAYVNNNYLSTEKPIEINNDGWPKTYSDSTCTITITREWHYNAWCYIAHLQFSDYSRFGSVCANDEWVSYETTSHAAKRIGAIFAVNGPYMTDSYAVVRSGKVLYDVPIVDDLAIYNATDGRFESASSLGLTGMMASEAVANNLVSDTFKFYNSTLVKDGNNVANPSNTDKAQRTFIATNGNPGDIYIVVAEGRYADGSSPGLTKHECAKLIIDLGCTYGVMLDGGGSSTMYFNGQVLNSADEGQRSVVDFICLK